MSLIADALKKIEGKKQGNNNNNEELEESKVEEQEVKHHRESKAERIEAAHAFADDAIEDRQALQDFISTNRRDIAKLNKKNNNKLYFTLGALILILFIAVLIYRQYDWLDSKKRIMANHTNEAYEANAKNSLGRPRGSNEPMGSEKSMPLQSSNVQNSNTNTNLNAAPAPSTPNEMQAKGSIAAQGNDQGNLMQPNTTDSNFVANPADINTLIPTESNVGSSSPLSIIPTAKSNLESGIPSSSETPFENGDIKKNGKISPKTEIEPLPAGQSSSNLQKPRNFPEYSPADNPLQNENINRSLPKPIYYDAGVNAILKSKPISSNGSVTLTSKVLTATSIKLFNEYLKAGHESRAAKNYVAAIEYYTSALELAESDEVIMLIAFSYLDMNNANMAFRTVINYSLRNESMLAILAIMAARMGAILEANKVIQYAYTLERSNDVIFAKGYISQLENKQALAFEAYRNVLDNEPNYANARYFLAQLYEANGQVLEAKNEYKKLATLNLPNEYKMIFIDKGK